MELTQEQIDRLVKDKLNEQRRKWYSNLTPQEKIDRRIRDYTVFLRSHGFEVVRKEVDA